ncbi:CUB domain-containing protein [Gilvibacter sediminis]|uniref:CUB domain-containing protein n=1 Tax=Gilvibacter sediminis TaxID=379071 RepID=UPI002350EF46|nr:CUB domain-containing protein [Gilvibacter sediminis]MDC7997797.1 CUB domain-containing protein [Gilvibacter sediminis]
MKKFILLLALGVVAYSCSEEGTDLDQNETNAFLESVDPKATPSAALDDSSLGMYHGFIATLDSDFNAKIWINAGNDGKFNATAKSIDGEKYSFFSHEADMAGTQFTFKGVAGTFTFDISDLGNPIVSDVTINGKDGISHVYKEFSSQRGVVSLGNYVDDGDAAFTGVWNLISDGSPHPAGAGEIITESFVLSPSGNPFTDTTIETFDFACFGQTGIPGLILLNAGVQNEIWLFDQSSVWGPATATYDLGVSSSARDFNNIGYDSFSNQNAGGTAGCFITESQGTWSWNGRTGTVSFPGDVPLPVLTCTDPISFSADTGGTITNYRNDENVTRVVTTADGSPMSLYFTSFNTESCCDFLTIYDGADATATEIGTYSGGDLFQQQIDGTGDSLTLVFTSDFSVTEEGWTAEVCGVAPPPLVCDEDFVDSGGTTGDYGLNEDTTTTFTAPLGQVVLATFQAFNIESEWDYMRVYDGATEDPATEVTTIGGATTVTANGNSGFTGTSLQGESFQSSGASLTFVFESDDLFTEPGWEICIQYVTAATVAEKGAKDASAIDAPFIMEEVEPMTFNK